MMSKTLVLLLIVSLAVNLAAAVTFGYYWWSERHTTREFGRRWSMERPEVEPDMLRRRLDLSKEQMETIEKERQALASDMRSLRLRSSRARRELMELLEEEEIDRGRADSLLSEVASLQADIERKVFEHLARMRRVLTPEQREHLLHLLQRRLHPRGAEHLILEKGMEGMRRHPRQGGQRGGDNGK
jgi:Spy/CpxP family protein refolding chaperone